MTQRELIFKISENEKYSYRSDSFGESLRDKYVTQIN